MDGWQDGWMDGWMDDGGFPKARADLLPHLPWIIIDHGSRIMVVVVVRLILVSYYTSIHPW
jgi:hypothetical protein